jgi:DNA mismatch repair protein MutL
MIKAAPELLGGRAVKGLILDLASELEETGLSRILEERVEGVLMTLACHSVIRGKKILTKEEGRALLTEMSKIDFAAHCPHGRLVVKEYKRTEIEALFGRR